MGKSERRMFSSHDTTKVLLKIHGPESLIGQRRAIEVKARVNTTWISLLNDKLELQIPLNQGIYISNTRHNQKKKTGTQRLAQLDEPVRHYINQYSQDRTYYTACIRRPTPNVPTLNRPKRGQAGKPNRPRHNSSPTKAPAFLPLPPCSVSLSPIRTSVLPRSPIRPAASPRSPVVVPSTSRASAEPSRFTGVTVSEEIPSPQRSESDWGHSPTNPPGILSTKSCQMEKSPIRNKHVSFSATRDPDEVNSVISSVSQQSVELGRQGIPSEDLKSSAANRFAQYDNNNLRLLKNEYKMLKLYRGGKRWQEFGMKAPHLALFVQNIFGN